MTWPPPPIPPEEWARRRKLEGSKRVVRALRKEHEMREATEHKPSTRPLTLGDVAMMDLESGSCVEVIRTGGPSDGLLLGYAIRFTDRWAAWVRRGNSMTCYGHDFATREGAVQEILLEAHP